MGVGRGPLGSRAPKALTLDTLLELPCETTVKPVVPAGSWNWRPRAHLVHPERERRADGRGRRGVGALDDGLHAARGLGGVDQPAVHRHRRGGAADRARRRRGRGQTDLPRAPTASADETGGASVPRVAGERAVLTGGQLHALVPGGAGPPAPASGGADAARKVRVVQAGEPARTARSAAGGAEVGRGPGARSTERGEQQAERQGEGAHAEHRA